MTKQKFGGDWTEDKLSRVAKYLERWNTALRHQPFTREYIDAFAGTGYREVRESPDDSNWFPELAEAEVQLFLDGSAKRALKVEPPFHRFTFIEKSPRKVAELEKLRGEYPQAKIRIEQGDANLRVQALCKENWDYRRAVLFLDPYGMQVAWETLEAVASTRCIDAWILLPLCAGMTRNLRASGHVEPGFRRRLDLMFGESAWADAFYRPKPRSDNTQGWLFANDGQDAEDTWKVDLQALESYFTERLEKIFAGVAKTPVRLCNSKNAALYSLFFVASNPRAKEIAIRIAESIMRRP